MEVSDEDGEEEGEPVTVPATTEEEEEEVCVRWSDGDCVNSVLVTLVVFWTDQLSWWYFPSHLQETAMTEGEEEEEEEEIKSSPDVETVVLFTNRPTNGRLCT